MRCVPVLTLHLGVVYLRQLSTDQNGVLGSMTCSLKLSEIHNKVAQDCAVGGVQVPTNKQYQLRDGQKPQHNQTA
jgi:hypothetical protein